MDTDLVLFLTLWAAFGALIGGVITPLIVSERKFNEWLAALIGVVVGMVGSVVLLVPLWLALSRFLKPGDHTERPWQRDALTIEEAEALAAKSINPVAPLGKNFWPAQPAEHVHSHRMTYLGVFLALAAITAVEVTLTYLDLGFSVTLPLVFLSLSKAVLVVMYFMHLRYENRWYSAMFALSLPFVALILIVLAAVAP